LTDYFDLSYYDLTFFRYNIQIISKWLNNFFIERQLNAVSVCIYVEVAGIGFLNDGERMSDELTQAVEGGLKGT
jgi:hypothetical protein